jgi:hypothetical protein
VLPSGAALGDRLFQFTFEDSLAQQAVVLFKGHVVASPVPEWKLWFDADDIETLFQDAAMTVPVTADGDPVGAWKDKSGLEHHVTATGDARPTYKTSVQNGKPVVRFDGIANLLTGEVSEIGGNTSKTLFMVVRFGGNSQTAFHLGGTGSPNAFGFRQNADGNAEVFQNSSGNGCTDGEMPATMAVVTVVKDENNLKFYINSELVAGPVAVDEADITSDTFGLGALDASGGFLDGDICELAVLNIALYGDLRELVENYLTLKWVTPPSSSSSLSSSSTSSISSLSSSSASSPFPSSSMSGSSSSTSSASMSSGSSGSSASSSSSGSLWFGTPKRIGISTPAHDRSAYFTLYVFPHELAFAIDLQVTAGPDKIKQITPLEYDTSKGTRRFKVEAQKASDPNTPDDVTLRATAGNLWAEHKLSVVVPHRIGDHPGKGNVPVVRNVSTKVLAIDSHTRPSADIAEGYHYVTAGVFYRLEGIQILDQFNNPVGDLYEGAEITETVGAKNVKLNESLQPDSTYSDTLV